MSRNIRRKVFENQKTTISKPKNGGDLQNFEELYVRERSLKMQADRELMDVKLAIERGKYLPKDEIDNANIQKIHAFKTTLMALPRRLAQDMLGLNANQMEVTMKTRFREILEKLSKM